jgi:thioredoxin reductase/bacterioferritin-associated ferredoxin
MTIIEYDLVIIGSGPAGMSAAIVARQYDLSVLVLDEQPTAGGQIFRNLEHLENQRQNDFRKLGPDYQSASKLVKQFKNCGADYLIGRSVWHIDKDKIVRISTTVATEGNKSSAFKAKRILIAVGAMERPIPLPGWTLPGVMACSSVDVLFKSAGLLPKGEVVLAGNGPLLLLIANRLLDAGVKISALLDTKPKKAFFKALPYLPAALRTSGYLLKGAGMILKLRASKVPIYSCIENIKAEGEEGLNQVRFKTNGQWRTIMTGLLLLHQGLVPNVQLSRLLGCAHQWYETQRYWEPVLDDWGNTTVEGIAVAGDCGRVSGSKVSELSGQIAAFEAAMALGIISKSERDTLSKTSRLALKKQRTPRPFIDQYFAPETNWIVPKDDETIVCRCEEVTARDIRDAVRLGIKSIDRIKAVTRCGMGFCQGRMCGLTASEIMADELNLSPADVGYQRVRSPLKPVTLGQLVDSD